MKRLTAAIAAIAFAGPAFAHVNPIEHGSVALGLLHPLTGLDHTLVMVAVGLWAAVLGGRALWMLPASFVLAMASGYGLALSGLSFPAVEPMILASVVLMGALVGFTARLPLAVAGVTVALFGLAHGAAHAAEVGGAGAVAFGVGFVIATGLLHGIGVAMARSAMAGLSPRYQAATFRGIGAATAALGLVMAFN